MKRLLAGAALVLASAVSSADTVFPARLQLTEIVAGTYEVSFTLPLLEGRVLRATPRLPPTCRQVTPERTEGSAGSVTRTWRVDCEPASLAGEAVLIEGLLGTQTELLVEIRTRDARLFSEIVKPSRPGFIVPEPPGYLALAERFVLLGMRTIASLPELWLLVAVAVLLGRGWGGSMAPAVGFAAAFAGAQWAADRTLLIVSPHAAPTLALASALVPALGLARGEGQTRHWLHPLSVFALLLGGLAGGARTELTLSADGLSASEQLTATVLFAVGAALGLSLIAAVLVEARRVLSFRLRSSDLARWAGYLVGVLAVGLLVHRATAFAHLTSPTLVPMLLLFVAVAAVWSRSRRSAALLGGLISFGIAMGFSGRPLPFGNLILVATLCALGLLLVLDRTPRFGYGIAAVGAVAHGWSAGRAIAENVSLPVATAAGTGLVSLCLLFVLSRWADRGSTPASRAAFRWLGIASLCIAVAARSADYLTWLEQTVATELALGNLPIPWLAILLILAAVVARPRRRRVLRELGVESPPSRIPWILVGLAFFVLPVGSVSVRNPMFEPGAPRGDDARRVLTQMLSSTYFAFNLRDEDELYETLSRNVSGDLVDDLYLDSRRRLTAGTREGAEITVRDVSVIEIDDDVRGATARSGFEYGCKWVVTARVRHLQHIHHRQNIYTGNVLVRADEDGWKIAEVTLTSEDRIVMPWNPS